MPKVESNWMSIIDLIQGCDLQLNPLPSLQKDFNKMTDVFFEELEKAENSFSGSSEDSKETASKLRTSISSYQSEAEHLLDLYASEMRKR